MNIQFDFKKKIVRKKVLALATIIVEKEAHQEECGYPD